MFGCFYFKNTLELIPCIIYAKETALSPNEETPQNLCTFGVSEKKKKTGPVGALFYVRLHRIKLIIFFYVKTKQKFGTLGMN